jgi:hypothetical protein
MRTNNNGWGTAATICWRKRRILRSGRDKHPEERDVSLKDRERDAGQGISSYTLLRRFDSRTCWDTQQKTGYSTDTCHFIRLGQFLNAGTF